MIFIDQWLIGYSKDMNKELLSCDSRFKYSLHYAWLAELWKIWVKRSNIKNFSLNISFGYSLPHSNIYLYPKSRDIIASKYLCQSLLISILVHPLHQNPEFPLMTDETWKCNKKIITNCWFEWYLTTDNFDQVCSMNIIAW